MDNLMEFLQGEVSLELSRVERIFAADGVSQLSNDEGDCYFLYIKKGSCTADHCGKEYSFSQDFAYIWENKHGSMTLTGLSEGFEAIYFGVKNTIELKNYMNYDEMTVLCSPTLLEDTALLWPLLEYMMKEHAVSSYVDELIKNKILWISIFLLLKNREMNENSKRVNDLAERIKQYIDDNYQKNISLDSIGKHFCITVDYVSHIFKDNYGISPIKYLINVRIRTAKWLLMNTMDSVNEISYKVGYENQAYFSTLFRKIVGMSPVNFRLGYKRIV